MNKLLRRFYLLGLVIAIAGLPYKLAAQSIKHSYRFFGDLSVSAAECGPALTPLKAAGNCGASATAGGFVSDNLPQCGLTRQVYSSNLHWGLSYPNTAGTVTGTYTIHLYVKNTGWGNQSWSRIIDFSNGTSDAGIYYKSSGGGNQRCLDFYPNGIIGACPFFELDTYYLLTFTRDGATGIIDVYVNNNRFISYNDAAGKYVGTAGVPILIYRDDQAVVCESAEAKFAYLSFTNEYSSQATVTAVYNDICTIANTNDATSFTTSATTACTGSQDITVTYTGSVPPGATGYNILWNWDGGTVISGSGTGPYVIRYNNGGTKKISLTITNLSCGTSETSDRQVQINAPVATVINRAICDGDSFEGYTSTGTYRDVFTTAGGCDSLRTLHLVVSSKTFTTVQRTICEGTSYFGHTKTGVYIDTLIGSTGCDSIRRLELQVVNTIRTAVSAQICTGESFEGYTQPGVYTDGYQSVNGCDSIRTLTLTLKASNGPDLGPDRSICTGDSLVLNPGAYNSYTWQDGSTSPVYIVKQAGVYSVTVSDNCGVATDEVLISTAYCDIIFPTGFTPNGDGRNDKFKLLRSGPLDGYQLQIFNRWGQKVFSTTDPTKGWDGIMGSGPAGNGIYVWHCTIRKGGETKSLKGVVTLLR